MSEAPEILEPVHPVTRGLDRLSSLVVGVAAVALLGLVVVQGWQVFARYVMNDSPSWTEPLTVLLLSTAMSMGAAAAVHENRHFGFFLLADAMRPRLQRVVKSLTPLIVICIGSVIAYWAMVLLIDGLDVSIAGANMPQSIGYLPLSIGGGLMVVFALHRLLLPPPPTTTQGVR